MTIVIFRSRYPLESDPIAADDPRMIALHAYINHERMGVALVPGKRRTAVGLHDAAAPATSGSGTRPAICWPFFLGAGAPGLEFAD